MEVEVGADPWTPAGLPRGRGRVVLEGQGAARELVLHNPEARNAVSPGMMLDLLAAVEQLEASPDVVVVTLRGGDGRAFCAGGDLVSVRQHLLAPGSAEGMARYMGSLLDRLAALPLVVQAAVEGAALGGGAELLTCCDHVVAAEDARVGFVHASLGVSPGWGGGARLVSRLGARRALGLLVPVGPPTAQAALDGGLVDQLCPPGAALQVARERAAAIATLPAEAVSAVVRVARSGSRQVEIEAFAQLWGGPAHRRALAALGQGRS